MSSYWLEDAGVFVDPLLPEDAGTDWFAEQPTRPQAVVMANRHHYRDSGAISERFGCKVYVPAAGMSAFTDGEPVVPYEPGDSLPGGLVAVQIGVLSPDDSGLFLDSARALWLADTIVRAPTDPDSRIGWVADSLMDDPEQTKQELLEVFTRILSDYDFDSLLLAHGLPLVRNGRSELEAFVHEGGRTAEDAF